MDLERRAVPPGGPAPVSSAAQSRTPDLMSRSCVVGAGGQQYPVQPGYARGVDFPQDVGGGVGIGFHPQEWATAVVDPEGHYADLTNVAMTAGLVSDSLHDCIS